MQSLNAIMAYGYDLYRLLSSDLDLPETEIKKIQASLASQIKDSLVRNGYTVVEDYTPRG